MSAPLPEVASVAVVIPARDEEGRIAACLASVLAAAEAVDVAVSIVVVDDGSLDGTADRARAVLDRAPSRAGHAVVPVRCNQASAARHAGFLHLLARMPAAGTWVLSTDADTIVPPDWIRRIVAHARAGAVAVAGVVTLIDDADAAPIRRRWNDDYGATIADDGTHPHVHAANLAIRLDVLAELGGFGSLDRIEDIELWRRLRAAGYRPVADASIVVATSARLEGRVERGFADALRRLYSPAALPSPPPADRPQPASRRPRPASGAVSTS